MSKLPFPNPTHDGEFGVNEEFTTLMTAIQKHGGIYDKTGEIRLIVGGKLLPVLGFRNDADRQAGRIAAVAFTLYQESRSTHQALYSIPNVDVIKPSTLMTIELIGPIAKWTHNPLDLWLAVRGCTIAEPLPPIAF